MSNHLIRIQAQNIKNVRALDITPNRYVTKISGANGAGKTSALDAVFYCLLGRKTLPKELIRQGEKKGAIFIETTTHLITRRLDDKGGSLQIEVKATGNLLKAPDDWLEGIAGSLGFDPLKFMRLKPEEQFEAIKALVPMEADVDDLETRNANDAETITRRRAEAKKLEAARDHITVDKTLPTETVNIEALLKESREAADFNMGIERAKRDREIFARQQAATNDEAKKCADKLKALREEVEWAETALRQSLDAVKEMEEKAKAWEPLEEPRDRSAIDNQIGEATRTNARIATNNANKTQRETMDKEIDTIGTELDNLEKGIRDRKLAISKALEDAKFPIPGLSFETQGEGSGGRERKNPKRIVTYKGIPLSDASTAEQIRVSTAIGMANKPELRFLLIRDGSLLDDTNLAILEQMAHEHDFQILMEICDTSGKVGIFIEEGSVKAVNQEPERDSINAAEERPKVEKKRVRKERG
jgi:hypothetical protein